MSDLDHPTNGEWLLFDAVDKNSPNYREPPHGADLLILNEGGVLVRGPWRPGIEAWAFWPKVPPSVKARQSARLAARLRNQRP